jgi:hypothetical protein
MSQQTTDPGQQMVQKNSESSLLVNSLLFKEASIFYLLRPSAGWMMFIYIMEGNLIQSKHTDLNDNFIQKCPTS